jgi:outer membrane protein assembly factor BamE (lipoprotein component of BamABCDE complex)
MRAVITVLCISALSASAVGAQTSATIDPGMMREQVVAKMGEPLSSRSYEGFTYLLQERVRKDVRHE